MRITLGPGGRARMSLDGALGSTWAEEKAAEMREMDLPLVGQFQPGDTVTVSSKWKRHWTFLNAPPPTRRLWVGLVGQEGTVDSTDGHGNVWVLDRFSRIAGGGPFPVPARFVVKLREAP